MADDESEGLQHATERYNLLVRIKSTVDGLLASNSVNVWSTYGGLARISDDLEHIFKHGLRELQVLIVWVAVYNRSLRNDKKRGLYHHCIFIIDFQFKCGVLVYVVD